MEGDGPVHDDPFEWKIAVASCDAVSADALTAGMMGFDYTGAGYIWYLHKLGCGNGDPAQMEILGENPDNHRRQFKPHSWYEWQKTWPDERARNILGI